MGVVGAAVSPAALAVPPAQWSREFVGKGVAWTQFEGGPLCVFAEAIPTSFPSPGQNGARLFVGGSFATVNTPAGPMTAKGVAIWNGRAWSTISGGGVDSGFGDGSPGTVQAITSTEINGQTQTVLAGFFAAPETLVGIGVLDSALALRPLAPGPISSAWFAGAYGWTPPGAGALPEIVVSSGLFPDDSPYAYRYTHAGVRAIPPGVVSVTNAFAEFDDGDGRALYLGIQSNEAQQLQPITRWDGVTSTPVSVGTMSFVTALCVHDDGSGPALYAAGTGVGRRRAGAGNSWEQVAGAGAPSFNIAALASFDDGTGPALYAAGTFTTQTSAPGGNAAAVNIVRLRSGVWEAVGTGLVGGGVTALAVYDEDGPGPKPAGLYAVGTFTTAGGIQSVGIARWGQPVCRADVDGSGAVTVQDVFEFLSLWFVSDPRADVDASAGVAIGDLFAFLTAWFAGC